MSFQVPMDQENVPARPRLQLQKQAGTSRLAEVTNAGLRNQPDRQAKKKTFGLASQQSVSTTSFSSNSLSCDVWKPNNNGWKTQTAKQDFTIFDENAVANPKDLKSAPQENVKPARQPLQNLKNTLPEKSFPSSFLYEPLNLKEQSSQDNNDCSPMVLDSSASESPVKTLSQRLLDIEAMVPESYIPGIYEYLRALETECRPKPHYMRKQQDITPQMRAILVDWLVEVAEEYKLHNETLFLAVSFIDRFLSKMSVLRGKLQLVGTAAMFIASKYEEIYPPDVGEFVYLTDDTYTKKQVLRMEQLILTVLSFRLGTPTASYFLQHFARVSSADNTTQHLASYLIELSLMEVEPFVKYLPSEIAAASLALARLTSGQELWPDCLRDATKYSMEDLIPCIKHLHCSWQQAPQQPQQAIVNKYKTEKWTCVSALHPPPLATLLDLAQL